MTTARVPACNARIRSARGGQGDSPRARQMDVVFASTSQEPTQKTGLVWPLCKHAYGAIEAQEAKHIAFKCQACGHRWHWDNPWPERNK